MPASLWSGNLRLSLVLIPVKLHAATTEGRVAFRMIHTPSGQPIRNVKGVRDGETFTEVPEEEIIKGYEHAKGHHVPIHPKELDDLKLEAKHTIDMVRFVDEAEIDSRYLEKPYYLTPDGDDADEGYTVIRDALKQTGKVAIGQLVMHGREHLVGIMPHGNGLMLVILRYAEEVRAAAPYFENIGATPNADAVALATKLIEGSSGPFRPDKMPDLYAAALHELVKAKLEQRAPEIAVEAKGEAPKVINIMAALKESIQSRGRAKVKETVRKRSGKPPKEEGRPASAHARPGRRRSVH
jgi:DNA end-binding protein Ku